MTQPAEQTDFKYFTPSDGIGPNWKVSAKGSWFQYPGQPWFKGPCSEEELRAWGWIETDATGTPLLPAPAAPGGEQRESVKVFRYFKCDCPGDQHWRFSGDNWQIAENLIDGKWEADTSMTLEDLDRPHYYEFTPEVVEPSPPAGGGEAANLKLALADTRLALRKMLRHTGVADANPEDKDGSDHRAEHQARRALEIPFLDDHQEFPEDGECGCRRCMTESGIHFRHMVICETCGNKRCPHATDHRHACTGSNEPNQPGSIYAESTTPPPAATPGTDDKVQTWENDMGETIFEFVDPEFARDLEREIHQKDARIAELERESAGLREAAKQAFALGAREGWMRCGAYYVNIDFEEEPEQIANVESRWPLPPGPEGEGA